MRAAGTSISGFLFAPILRHCDRSRPGAHGRHALKNRRRPLHQGAVKAINPARQFAWTSSIDSSAAWL